jgi:FkbM family methyltransferase
MKALVQRAVRKYGYEIRKAPLPNFRCVSVFHLALNYLIAVRGEKKTFLEVGANDGSSGDDALHEFILKHKWKGVLVEPQPDVFARLKANYAGVHEGIAFENVAVSTDPKPLTMYRLAPSAPGSTLGTATVASAHAKIAAKQLQMSADKLERIEVPTARLDDIVARHGLSELDILQLDTEGFDWDALQTLDLKKTRPWLIRFEHGHLSPEAIAAMTRHLNDHEYDVHFGGYESDSVALRKDFVKA